MHDIVELLNDPDFVTEFVINIPTGTRQADGEYVEVINSEKKEGVIQPASSKETQFMFDGDEHRQVIKVWSSEYLSTVDRKTPQLGDTLEWHCNEFRVMSVKDWSQYGYWQAMAVQLIRKKDG